MAGPIQRPWVLLLRFTAVVMLFLVVCEWSEEYHLWGAGSSVVKLNGESVADKHADLKEPEKDDVTSKISSNSTNDHDQNTSGSEPRGEGNTDDEKTSQTEDGTRQDTNDVEEIAKRPSIQERLIPPFRVVQLGVPRSGSTFQFRLLDVLVRMKSDPTEKITTTYVGAAQQHDQQLAGNSFVLKSHRYNNPERWTKAQDTRRVVVFGSADSQTQHLVNVSDYIQLRENLDECSLCEVDKYKDLFHLTEEEVKLVKTYMLLYEKLRQCCSKQMSRYNAMRLNGCNMTEYKDKPGYPHCEDHDFEEIEREFDSLPLSYTVFPGDANCNWARPGDCAKFEKRMASGYFFVNVKFTTCEAALEWKHPRPFRI